MLRLKSERSESVNLARAVQISGDGGQERRHLAKQKTDAGADKLPALPAILPSLERECAASRASGDADLGQHQKRPTDHTLVDMTTFLVEFSALLVALVLSDLDG